MAECHELGHHDTYAKPSCGECRERVATCDEHEPWASIPGKLYYCRNCGAQLCADCQGTGGDPLSVPSPHDGLVEECTTCEGTQLAEVWS